MHTSRNNCPIVVSSEEELFQRLVERSKGELTGTIDYKKSLENISQNGHSLEGVIRLVHTLGQRLLTKQEPPSQCYKFAAELESVMEAYGQITNDFQLEADSHQLIFDLSLPLALETNNTTHEADLRMDLIEGLLLENLESTFSSKIEAELQNCAANIESLGSHARLDQRLRYSRITLECMIVEAPSNLRELVVKRISSVQGLYNDIRPGDHDAAKEYVRSLVIGGTFLISEDALTREQLQFCESSASEALEMIENFQDADVDFEENDFSLQYIRGIALYELGDYEEALAPLNALLAEEQVTEMLEDLFPGGNAESRFQEALNKCLEEEEFDSFNGLGTIRSSHSDWDLDLGFTPPSESFDDYTPWTNEDSSED